MKCMGAVPGERCEVYFLIQSVVLEHPVSAPVSQIAPTQSMCHFGSVSSSIPVVHLGHCFKRVV